MIEIVDQTNTTLSFFVVDSEGERLEECFRKVVIADMIALSEHKEDKHE